MATALSPETRPARDWPFDVKPLHPVLGGEIQGITLADAVERGLGEVNVHVLPHAYRHLSPLVGTA